MGIATFSFIIITFKNTNFISELSGLSRQNLILANSFSLVLFSIAGIPPLAGFFSKYLILLEALGNNLIMLAIIGILASSIAIFYYIRIIK
jgi:NADH-quinone oxidoreductase subunit N